MTRTVRSHRTHAGAVLALPLMLCLCLLAGCAGGEATEDNTGDDGLKPSELAALKKASKGHGGLQKALMKRKIEQLQREGVVVKITPSGKTKKGPR